MRHKTVCRAWLQTWIGASLLHFLGLFWTSIFFGWSRHREWLEVLLAPFATAAEWVLVRTVDYHGQDVIQWPLIILNSLLCGGLIAILLMSSRQLSMRAESRDSDEIDSFFQNL